MPEYEVNLVDISGEHRRQIRLPAATPQMALNQARDLAGPGTSQLVSVHEVTLTPVLLPTGPVPGSGEAVDDTGDQGGHSGDTGGYDPDQLEVPGEDTP